SRIPSATGPLVRLRLAIALPQPGRDRLLAGARRTVRDRSRAAAIPQRANCAVANLRGWARPRSRPVGMNEGPPARLSPPQGRSGAPRRANQTLARWRGVRTPRPRGRIARAVPEGRRPPAGECLRPVLPGFPRPEPPPDT